MQVHKMIMGCVHRRRNEVDNEGSTRHCVASPQGPFV